MRFSQDKRGSLPKLAVKKCALNKYRFILKRAEGWTVIHADRVLPGFGHEIILFNKVQREKSLCVEYWLKLFNTYLKKLILQLYLLHSTLVGLQVTETKTKVITLATALLIGAFISHTKPLGQRFPSRLITRTALREGFPRPLFKEAIIAEPLTKITCKFAYPHEVERTTIFHRFMLQSYSLTFIYW